MAPRTKKKPSSAGADAKSAARALSATTQSGPPAWAVTIVLAICIAAVYGRAVHAPFILDDHGGIVDNRSIVSLWPLVGTSQQPGPLNPGKEMPSAGRPLVNLSLAINYRFGGFNPVGYHVFSITLHFCSAMLLWAITRRTLRLTYFRGEFDTSAGWLALAVALIWALHPLQTEAVSYISQRTELMMALFYLATLYCSLRFWALLPKPLGEGRDEGALSFRAIWLALAVIACSAGMASKEVMVSAPLMVLLFERTFIAGSLKTARRQSWPLYLGLAATWILLLLLCLGSPRPDSTGFDHDVTAYEWWLTQSKVLLMYLKLVVWPWPLMIHYLLPYETALAESWRYVFPVMLLAIGTLWLLWRNHPVGYLGTWMFSILSATSLIPIITETAAERRMYLPIAALSALFVVGGYSILRRVLRERTAGSRGGVNRRPALIMAFAVTLLAVCYGVVSANRVGTYLDPFELWQQVVKAQPENHIARENMGHQFEETGDIPGAIKEYREAIRLQPGFAMAHNSLGFLFIHAKAYPEAIVELREAVRNDPRRVLMRSNLAAALFASGKVEPALAELRTALELEPENWIIHKNMAYALQVAGRHPESIEYYQRALALNSKDVSMYGSIAQSLVQLKRREQAIATLKQGIALAQGAGDIANAEMLSAQLNKIR